MPARTFPNIGLKGGYDEHEDGWADDQNVNLLKLSVLSQCVVLSKVSATPGSPAPGAVYLFSETHPTQPNVIAIWEGPVGEESWTYAMPLEGWLAYNMAMDYYEKFSGTAWAELEMGGSSGGGTESLVVAVGDESTAITTGAAKVTFRMPYAFTLTAVRASLTTASSSGIPTVDINEGGASILSTKLTIDAGEKTSVTAATAVVISDGSLADDAEITIDIDVAGTGAAGLKVYLIGHQ